MKKFLAGFLAVVMLLTGLSLTAFAANEGAKVPDATITVDAEGFESESVDIEVYAN